MSSTRLHWDTVDFYCPEDPEWDEELGALDQETAWEALTETLTQWMEQLATSTPLDHARWWHVTVTNFGWQHQDGQLLCQANNGAELLLAVLPATECTFSLQLTPTTIELDNAHHDAPTGGEHYVIRCATEEEIDA